MKRIPKCVDVKVKARTQCENYVKSDFFIRNKSSATALDEKTTPNKKRQFNVL